MKSVYELKWTEEAFQMEWWKALYIKTWMTATLRAQAATGAKPGEWDRLAQQGGDAAPK